MNAKNNDLARIQEIWDVASQTATQIEELSFAKTRFLNPTNSTDDLIAEGLMNRVFRITEETGQISDDTAQRYGFERSATSGVRNRLAHAYGEVDREIIWEVIDSDLAVLQDSCIRYAEDMGVDLSQ